MKRWGVWFLLSVIACLPVLAAHASLPGLLNDTDTAVLLRTIRAQNAPFSWFLGDWPLHNHFYRPVATLAFELDNRLYGNHAVGYGWTNDLLCVACVLLLFWLVRELFDRPALAGASSILFALWLSVGTSWLGEVLYAAAWAILLIGAYRHRRAWRAYIPAFCVSMYFLWELAGVASLRSRMIEWLPGRTASVMGVFALTSLASYARYERLSPRLAPIDAPTPLTPPATRSTTQSAPLSGARWPWIALCLVCLALAMASYEQGVMTPAALLGVAILFAMGGRRPAWGWQAAFWGLLLGYVGLRTSVVPTSASHYQLQQFRHGPGVFMSLLQYVFPALDNFPSVINAISDPIGAIATGSLFNTLLFGIYNVVALWFLRKRLRLALAGYALSVIFYLPMAWLKQFDHYHFMPMAMRTMLVGALGWTAAELSLTALRPPIRQAPPRSDPAPGSLPRP